MNRFARYLLAFGLSLAPLGAAAHPHVFIDAGLRLIYGEGGKLTEVEVEWRYDAFYSLLILEDYGIRPAAGGGLSASDAARLAGFDWDPDPAFEGALYLTVEGRRVGLQQARDFGVSLEGGQIVSRHRRALSTPIPGEAQTIIQVYDPEFYVDFSVPQSPALRGRDDCHVDLRPGDSYAAADAYAAALREALARELASASLLDEEMISVNIGSVGAPEMRVVCGAAR
ncbi:DUF1007 family protein [Paracoccus bogoriensis]|uniref:DUF1007 family protein n=1 Tax=Paracoccus bogoriensis TaxID=242065 RepID=UPI001C670849|nr:DUF1007 family protein [Paracoccus bogoriensis]MBW7055895.1 DUF1007 family protein [Paracoccus bogoriensis]